MTYNTYMEKYIVLLTDGKALIFETYKEACKAVDRYMEATGKVACVEQFWSVV